MARLRALYDRPMNVGALTENACYLFAAYDSGTRNLSTRQQRYYASDVAIPVPRA